MTSKLIVDKQINYRNWFVVRLYSTPYLRSNRWVFFFSLSLSFTPYLIAMKKMSLIEI